MTPMELLRKLYNIGPELTDHDVVAFVIRELFELRAEVKAINSKANTPYFPPPPLPDHLNIVGPR